MGGVLGVQGAVQGPVLVAVQGAVIVSSGRFQSHHSDECGNLPWHVQTLIPSIQNTNVYLHTYITRSITSQGNTTEREGQVGPLKTRYLLWIQIC